MTNLWMIEFYFKTMVFKTFEWYLCIWDICMTTLMIILYIDAWMIILFETFFILPISCIV